MNITLVEQQHARAVAELYNHFIESSIATFEETRVSEQDIAGRFSDVAQAGLPWLVAEGAGNLLGYAYASKWNGRCAYRFSAEVTVYIAPAHHGEGIGTKLYNKLFAELQARDYHTAIAGISLPNAASVALHERFGMEKIAHFSEVGFKFGHWIDVGYWQIVFAREQEN